jgi:acetoacetate decarboxylase
MSVAGDPRVDLSSGRPQGLPFLAPLYGPGPYQFRDGMSLSISYRADPEEMRRTLPRELELAGDTMAITFAVWPECSGIGGHSFSMPLIPVTYGDLEASWIPYLYTSTDASLACYREVQGWPAVLGTVELTHAKGEVRARVVRNGHEVISATASVGGEPFGEDGETASIILYKEIPSLDTTGTDVATFLHTMSLLTNVSMQAGTGTLAFPDPSPTDLVARLAPVEVLGAAFGSCDDLYPAQIRAI